MRVMMILLLIRQSGALLVTIPNTPIRYEKDFIVQSAGTDRL